MVDNIMVGSLGEVALSSVSLANTFIHVFQIFCMGIGRGFCTHLAFWGMQDLPSLRKVVTIMLRLVLGFGGFFTLVTIFIPHLYADLYPDAELIAEGMRYFAWSIPSYLLLGFSLTCTIVLRSTGQVRLPLISSLVAFFVNIFFNWLFIFGNLGAPGWVSRRAALGTMIARVVEFVVICGFFFFREQRIGYRIRHLFESCHGMVRTYLVVAFPVLVSDALLAFGQSAVAMIMGRIGAGFVSANAITAVTQQLSTVLISGMSNASAIITGPHLGEGDVEKAQRQGVTFLTLGVIVGIFAGGLIMAFSETIIGCTTSPRKPLRSRSS
jgi:putative MATE family efflux protein